MGLWDGRRGHRVNSRPAPTRSCMRLGRTPLSPPVRPGAGTRAGGGGLVESGADTVGGRRQARGLAKNKNIARGTWNGQRGGMPKTCERQVTARRCACSRSTRTSSTCIGATPCR